MKFETIWRKEEEPLPDLITDKTVQECLKLASNPEDAEGVRAFVDTYLETAIKNTDVFESKEGVAIPFTKVCLSEVARTLSEKYKDLPNVTPPEGPTHTSVEEAEEDRMTGAKQEYIFVNLAAKAFTLKA